MAFEGLHAVAHDLAVVKFYVSGGLLYEGKCKRGNRGVPSSPQAAAGTAEVLIDQGEACDSYPSTGCRALRESSAGIPVSRPHRLFQFTTFSLPSP